MPNDVTPAALRRLLDLQAEDTAIRQLETRWAALPEAQQLAELNESLSELEADLDIAGKQRDEIERDQSRLEGEIRLLEDKITREEQRMFSGSVANPKELSALQAEVESLKRRHAGLEESLLDVMVQGESAVETWQRLTSEREATAARTKELGDQVAEIKNEIDSALARHHEQRAAMAPEIPESVHELYERLRDQKGGVGAAALVGGTCEGCHTKLPNKEVERLRAEGGLQRCDNCRRILVVT
ncbi:MAG: zinc ribbon domain-containing protein [Actinomycetota bacterium]